MCNIDPISAFDAFQKVVFGRAEPGQHRSCRVLLNPTGGALIVSIDPGLKTQKTVWSGAGQIVVRLKAISLRLDALVFLIQMIGAAMFARSNFTGFLSDYLFDGHRMPPQSFD
jgi:hypothetical protein